MSEKSAETVVELISFHVLGGDHGWEDGDLVGAVVDMMRRHRECRADNAVLVEALQRIHDECLKYGIYGIGNIALDAMLKAREQEKVNE